MVSLNLSEQYRYLVYIVQRYGNISKKLKARQFTVVIAFYD